jgi:Rrf2 family protein
MIRLSKKVEYALISILHLADGTEDNPVSVREIVEEYKLPQELVGKILQKLVKAGIVESVQGVKGGYILKKRLDQISLKDIIEIVDGSVRLTRCSTRHDTFCSCQSLKSCNIKNAIYYLQKDIQAYFDSIKLNQFIDIESLQTL